MTIAILMTDSPMGEIMIDDSDNARGAASSSSNAQAEASRGEDADFNSVDRRIIGGLLLNVDLSEIYSPARIAQACLRFGLTAGDSMDLLTGYDFDKAEDRRRAFKNVAEKKPRVLVGSPPCTLFSSLMRWCRSRYGGGPKWEADYQEKYLKARRHVEFCAKLYRFQVANARHFLHEHPWSASSWDLTALRS